jgi:hypothetical protein
MTIHVEIGVIVLKVRVRQNASVRITGKAVSVKIVMSNVSRAVLMRTAVNVSAGVIGKETPVRIVMI